MNLNINNLQSAVALPMARQPATRTDVGRLVPVSVVVLVHAALLILLGTSRHEAPPQVTPPSLAFITLVAAPAPPAQTTAARRPPAKSVTPRLPPVVPAKLRHVPARPDADRHPAAVQGDVAPAALAPSALAQPSQHAEQEVAVTPAVNTAPAPTHTGNTDAAVQAGYMQMPRSYPAQSRALGEEGTVLLRVRVDIDGKPLAAEVLQSSGFERLDNDARRTVMKWRFNPATANGQPVQASVKVPLRYSLTR